VGFDTANIPQIGSTHPDDVKKHPLWDPSIGGDAARLKKKIDDAGQYKGNNHPTVKPIELMKYLIKLITPPGGTVLDPFNGSGSTGCAAVELGHPYIGCELDSKYVDIANTRIEAWAAACNPTQFHQLFSTE
jgi:DNA modification methylase